MIDSGLFYKSYRETRLMCLLFCAGLLCLEFLLAAVLPMFGEQAANMMQMPFVRSIFSAMLGMDIGDSVVAEAMAAFAWVHPAILIVIWSQVTVFCARLPAGEIGSGTFDMILAMPISRWRIFTTQTVLGLLWGLLLMVSGLLGCKLGMVVFNETGLSNNTLIAVVCNLFCLYLAVGGLAMLASCFFNRRGSALGLVFGVLVLMMVLNFLVQLWGPAKNLDFLSLLNYYQPMTIIGATWPLSNMLVLLGTGLICWLIGGAVFHNKDIPV